LPGEANLPANGADGALGVFRSVWFAPGKDNRFQAVAGDSFVAAIEFSNPVKAVALNSYGNATQPGSPTPAISCSSLLARNCALYGDRDRKLKLT
jgi:acyl-homoserine-lactone acylase